MGVIKFTKGDVLRNKTLPDGWKSFQIAKYEEKINNKKDGINHVVTFSLIDAGTELDGKEIVVYFSDKAISRLIPLAAAIDGKDASSINDEFEFDASSFEGAKVDGLVSQEVYEGSVKNVINDFLPYKKAASIKSVF